MKREPLPFSEAPFCERPRSRSLPPNSAGQKLQNEEIAATSADAAAAAASTIGSGKKMNGGMPDALVEEREPSN